MVDCLLTILVNQICRLFSTHQTPDSIITRRWLDNTVENYGGDREVSSNVDDDGRLHLMVHDVVVTDLEEIGDGQHYYMTVEQIESV